MIVFKNGLSNKEKKHVTCLLCEMTDVYSDFYITQNNLRLFIKENQNILFQCLKKGDKLAFNDKGLALVCGFSDNAPRKYLKFLTKEVNDIDGLIKVVCWHVDCDLFVKIKKNNPQREVLQKNYFKFVGDRGNEILLVRKARKYVNRTKAKDS